MYSMAAHDSSGNFFQRSIPFLIPIILFMGLSVLSPAMITVPLAAMWKLTKTEAPFSFEFSEEASAEIPPYPYASDRNESDTPLFMRRICGTWQKDYLSLDATQRGNPPEKQRLLVFSSFSNCSFGDHFAGLTSAFLLSVVFGRSFMIDWDPLVKTDTLQPATFDWRPNRGILNHYGSPKQYVGCPLEKTDTAVELNFLNFINYGTGKVEYAIIFNCLESLRNVPLIRLQINWGFTNSLLDKEGYWGQEIRDLGLLQPYISGCLLRFLFRPHPNLEGSIRGLKQLLANTNKLSICIYAETGSCDSSYHQLPVNSTLVRSAEPLFNCAEKLYDTWGDPIDGTIWFLMSNSLEIRDIFRNRYPGKVILKNVDSHKIRDQKYVFSSILAEWYLMTQCDLFVFHNSGLPKAPALFSLKPKSMFALDASVQSGECDPMIPSKLSNIGQAGSGF